MKEAANRTLTNHYNDLTDKGIFSMIWNLIMIKVNGDSTVSMDARADGLMKRMDVLADHEDECVVLEGQTERMYRWMDKWVDGRMYGLVDGYG